MIALLGLWRYGLVAALLAAAGVWHRADKSKAVEDAVELVRAEYITAALVASESARAREQQLITATERVKNDFQIAKQRNATAARATADRLRGLEAALADSRLPDPDPTTPTRVADPSAAIAGECGRALVALDEYATDLAATAGALQRYIINVQLVQKGKEPTS